MNWQDYDVVIIGGGPAGMAAALSAEEQGINRLLIIERDSRLGGILNQCIHSGFGLHYFGEELTGPEYAAKFIEKIKEKHIEYRLNTMVTQISAEKTITCVSRQGIEYIRAKAIVLSMGCRERAGGALSIPGYRPAGIYTAGTAQRYINIEGYMPGKQAVILGSGDIGLIMARRMTLEGAKVMAVCEIMPYSTGLKRNIAQCLEDFDIPLYLSHTVTCIHGQKRVEGVTIAKVDENRKPIPDTERYISCDALLLSVGLIPENELSKEIGIALSPITGGPIVTDDMATSREGIFAGGNVVHVHDLADNVTLEAMKAGKGAAEYVKSGTCSQNCIEIKAGAGIRYVVPQKISEKEWETVTLYFRVDKIYNKSEITITSDGKRLMSKKKILMTPGEMESVFLTPNMLSEIQGQREILIEVKDGEKD